MAHRPKAQNQNHMPQLHGKTSNLIKSKTQTTNSRHTHAESNWPNMTQTQQNLTKPETQAKLKA